LYDDIRAKSKGNAGSQVQSIPLNAFEGNGNEMVAILVARLFAWYLNDFNSKLQVRGAEPDWFKYFHAMMLYYVPNLDIRQSYLNTLVQMFNDNVFDKTQHQWAMQASAKALAMQASAKALAMQASPSNSADETEIIEYHGICRESIVKPIYRYLRPSRLSGLRKLPSEQSGKSQAIPLSRQESQKNQGGKNEVLVDAALQLSMFAQNNGITIPNFDTATPWLQWWKTNLYLFYARPNTILDRSNKILDLITNAVRYTGEFDDKYPMYFSAFSDSVSQCEDANPSQINQIKSALSQKVGRTIVEQAKVDLKDLEPSNYPILLDIIKIYSPSEHPGQEWWWK